MIKKFAAILTIIILTTACTSSGQLQQKNNITPEFLASEDHSNPHVILLMIDSLSDHSLKTVIEENKAPALKFFFNNGQYIDDLVSSYPTMSVTIDSSLITGTYPDQHKIPSLVWFDDEKEKIATYGNGLFEVLKVGVSQFAQNGLYDYNNTDLSPEVTTIHEDLDRSGMKTASINTLIYRGNYEHTLKVPSLVSALTGLPAEIRTAGPAELSLGAFSQLNPDNDHIINRLGLNDAFAAEELKYLLQKGTLPPFTIVYFPENDHTVHKKGPSATDGLERLDKQLQGILDTFPEWESALNNIVWMIVSDSNQSAVINDKKKALIDLREAYKEFNILKLGEKAGPGDDLALAANERMAYIYNLGKEKKLEELAKEVLGEPRIAWIAWKETNKVHVLSPHHEGSLQFSLGASFKDKYNQSWEISGNSSILDLSFNGNEILYGDYPDGLARVYGAANSQKGEFLILDAQPGFEFIGESSPHHEGGGAHGSLHKIDSSSPLIVAGTNKSIEDIRLVDLKEWILELLNAK